MAGNNENEICCSFCGKPQAVADRLIAVLASISAMPVSGFACQLLRTKTG